jgi:hypothetical protein
MMIWLGMDSHRKRKKQIFSCIHKNLVEQLARVSTTDTIIEVNP